MIEMKFRFMPSFYGLPFRSLLRELSFTGHLVLSSLEWKKLSHHGMSQPIILEDLKVVVEDTWSMPPQHLLRLSFAIHLNH
jgi:hypothetical protein